MACTVEERRQARAAAERLGSIPAIASADLLGPNDGLAGWTVVAQLRRDRERFPPAVAQVLAEHGLALLEAGPGASGSRVIAAV